MGWCLHRTKERASSMGGLGVCGSGGQGNCPPLVLHKGEPNLIVPVWGPLVNEMHGPCAPRKQWCGSRQSHPPPCGQPWPGEECLSWLAGRWHGHRQDSPLVHRRARTLGPSVWRTRVPTPTPCCHLAVRPYPVMGLSLAACAMASTHEASRAGARARCRSPSRGWGLP